jgi:alkanesulfonate monooxygenase SsuD/methylene tetrahydromethanopterin reductase-like flavin-dependent oxidoreductase (luciferase family)
MHNEHNCHRSNLAWSFHKVGGTIYPRYHLPINSKYSKDTIITAERNGFDSVYAYDHFIPHYRYPTTENFFECFTLLSAISTYTKRLNIGGVVTCNS